VEQLDSSSEEEGDDSESEDDGIQPEKRQRVSSNVLERSREESKAEDG
jgi:hypothetical protein